jgi:transposase
MKKRKVYSPEFKEEAMRLVEEDGLSCLKVEKKLNIGKSLVSHWIREKKKLGSDAFCGSGNVRKSEKELVKVKKELARVKREHEILKKAIAIFSKEKNPYLDL